MKKILITAFLAINIFAVYAQSFPFRGTVVNEDNEPIANVMVKVKELSKILTLTDFNGKFEIPLPNTMKYCTVVFSAANYMTPEYHIDLNTNDVRIVMIKKEKVTADKDIPKNSAIYGTVKDRITGKPVPFANVVILSSEGVIAGVQTDSDGKYTIKSISSGTYTLQFSYNGYLIQQVHSIEVGADKTMPLNITLQPTAEKIPSVEITDYEDIFEVDTIKSDAKEKVTADKDISKNSAISGTVKDRITGKPVPFANVAILTNKGKIVTGCQSDFNGKYAIKTISSGTYTMQISCVGYQTQKIAGITVGADKTVQQNITLNPTTETLKSVEITDYEDIFEADYDIRKMSISAEEVKSIFSKDGEIGSVSGTLSGSEITSDIKSGTLTSGEVNDFAKWHLWGDILKNDFNKYADIWGFKPLQRYMAQLTNKQGMPVSNAQVTLKNSNGDLLWQAKTDNTGKAELWIDFFKQESKTDLVGLKLVFEYEGKTTEINNVTSFEQGINTAQIETECNKRNKVDMFFMIDATGSMSDEMRYLQVELDDIIQKINEQQSELQLRTGSLVYRDHGDAYLTRKTLLSNGIDKTLNFLREQSADGGGDYPEAVDVALFESITNENWDDDALARILFIVLDAPSHTEPDVIARLESQLRLAAQKGIRIVPIACSDIKKDGEYLMRTFALATNGTYLFLTDDSGVGNAHIKPTTDKYDVEKLNDAIVRVIKQYTKMPDCNNPEWAQENKDAEPSDKFVPNPYDEKPEKNVGSLTVSDVIKVYPNPCSDILKVDILKDHVKDIYIVDITGKTIFGVKVSSHKTLTFNVQTLSTGMYFVKAFYMGKWFTEKIIVIR